MSPCFFQIGDDLGFIFYIDILGLKIVVHINPQSFHRKIADVAGTGRHIIVLSNIFFQGFDFSWRFDNNKRLCQCYSSKIENLLPG